MMRLLAETFSPALAASVPGSLVAVTTSLTHVARIQKYSTLATLSYQGKKWVGGADGEWKYQAYELLSFRYVRGGFGSGPGGPSTGGFKVGWGKQLTQGGGKDIREIRKCPIGKPAFNSSYAKCVGAISAAGHRKKKAFTGKIIGIVTNFHLDHCEMVAALDSQVARLAGAYSDSGASQGDGSEGDASQEDGSADTRSFFVAPFFTCSGKNYKELCRDFCTGMGTKTTATTFECATCQRKCRSMRAHPLCSSAPPSATNCCSPSCCSEPFPHALGELAHFGPPRSHPSAIDANVHEFNAKTDPELFRICCSTCNKGRHGTKSAVVITALLIEEKGLEWPEVTLPDKNGMWASKGSRAPWEIGSGYNKGFIPMPTAGGGWAVKPGESISLSVVGLFLVSVCVHSPITPALT
jgi:hypothetical protein